MPQTLKNYIPSSHLGPCSVPETDLKTHCKFLHRPILSHLFLSKANDCQCKAASSMPRKLAFTRTQRGSALLAGLCPGSEDSVPGSCFTCSLLLLFSKPGFFFFLMGLVDVSCGEWPLEECGGLGNFLFWAVLSAEPGSERDTGPQVLKQSGRPGPHREEVWRNRVWEQSAFCPPTPEATSVFLLPEYTCPLLGCLPQQSDKYFFDLYNIFVKILICCQDAKIRKLCVIT